MEFIKKYQLSIGAAILLSKYWDEYVRSMRSTNVLLSRSFSIETDKIFLTDPNEKMFYNLKRQPYNRVKLFRISGPQVVGGGGGGRGQEFEQV